MTRRSRASAVAAAAERSASRTRSASARTPLKALVAAGSANRMSEAISSAGCFHCNTAAAPISAPIGGIHRSTREGGLPNPPRRRPQGPFTAPHVPLGPRLLRPPGEAAGAVEAEAERVQKSQAAQPLGDQAIVEPPLVPAPFGADPGIEKDEGGHDQLGENRNAE